MVSHDLQDPNRLTISRWHALVPDIPPRWVMVAAKRTFEQKRRWADVYDFLSAYYDIPDVTVRVDPNKVPQKAIACYHKERPGQGAMIYSKEGRVAPETAFHEFGHHLHATLLKGRLTHEANEYLAKAYARAMADLWMSI